MAAGTSTVVCFCTVSCSALRDVHLADKTSKEIAVYRLAVVRSPTQRSSSCCSPGAAVSIQSNSVIMVRFDR